MEKDKGEREQVFAAENNSERTKDVNAWKDAYLPPQNQQPLFMGHDHLRKKYGGGRYGGHEALVEMSPCNRNVGNCWPVNVLAYGTQ